MNSIEKTDEEKLYGEKTSSTSSSSTATTQPKLKECPPTPSVDSSEAKDDGDDADFLARDKLKKSKLSSKGGLHSPVGSAHSFDLQVWHFKI